MKEDTIFHNGYYRRSCRPNDLVRVRLTFAQVDDLYRLVVDDQERRPLDGSAARRRRELRNRLASAAQR